MVVFRGDRLAQVWGWGEAETVGGPVSRTESYNDPFGASMGHGDTIDADVARGC